MTKPRAPRPRRRLYGREADLAGVEQGGADPDDRAYTVKKPVRPTSPRRPRKPRRPPVRATTPRRPPPSKPPRIGRPGSDTGDYGPPTPRKSQGPSATGNYDSDHGPSRPPKKDLWYGPVKSKTRGAGSGKPRRGVPKIGIASAMRRGANEDKYSGRGS